jgi:hypothetical protein
MSNSETWVDFKVIKEAVTIDMVLNHYGITGLKKRGNELRGKCPIHRAQSGLHFAANLDKNVFKCFFDRCGAHGNVLDFVAAFEHCSTREAAMKLKEWFATGESPREPPPEPESETMAADLKKGIYADANGNLYEVTCTAAIAEDLETLVVYRELFGDFNFWVGSPALFSSDKSKRAQFRFLKSS